MPTQDSGIHVYATESCRPLRIAGSVFLGGNNGVNLSFKAWWPDSLFETVNNTFVGTRY